MKKQQQQVKPIIVDCAGSKEEMFIYENVIFTDISTQEINNSPICNYQEFLDLISVCNGLKCRFKENLMVGKCSDINKARKIFINSIKYN